MAKYMLLLSHARSAGRYGPCDRGPFLCDAIESMKYAEDQEGSIQHGLLILLKRLREGKEPELARALKVKPIGKASLKHPPLPRPPSNTQHTRTRTASAAGWYGADE